MKKQIKELVQAIHCLSITKAWATVVFTVFCIHSYAMAPEEKGNKTTGVQIGTITYSYRSMADQSLPAILNYVIQSGLSSVELMGNVVEQYVGMPQGKDPLDLRKWRATVSMDKFKEIRKIFNDKEVKINILKLGDKSWSDEELDYAFNACKALGARGISMEISEEAAKRLEPFAEKHNLYVIFHNHGQPVIQTSVLIKFWLMDLS